MVFAAGKLVDNQIKWRGDSGLSDGKEAGVDLSKGMYDAGDHMKFGFPMAYTATVLSWSILEYGDQMKAVDMLEPAKDSLKWITDYLRNAHASDDVLYVQVSLIILHILIKPLTRSCSCEHVKVNVLATNRFFAFEVCTFQIILICRLSPSVFCTFSGRRHLHLRVRVNSSLTES